MTKRLRGKFADNLLMAGSGNPWWPDHCLGHGCAEWAHQAVKALVDHVSSVTGIHLHYKLHEDEKGWFDWAQRKAGDGPGDS